MFDENGVTFSGFTGIKRYYGYCDGFGIQELNTADGASRSGVVFALRHLELVTMLITNAHCI